MRPRGAFAPKNLCTNHCINFENFLPGVGGGQEGEGVLKKDISLASNNSLYSLTGSKINPTSMKSLGGAFKQNPAWND